MCFKVHVNYETCAALAVCESIVAEVFEIQPDGHLLLKDDRPDEELRDAVIAAADTCPTASITVTQDSNLG